MKKSVVNTKNMVSDKPGGRMRNSTQIKSVSRVYK